jgi:hypothetical protein
MTVACDGGAGAQAGVRHREERAPPPNRAPKNTRRGLSFASHGPCSELWHLQVRAEATVRCAAGCVGCHPEMPNNSGFSLRIQQRVGKHTLWPQFCESRPVKLGASSLSTCRGYCEVRAAAGGEASLPRSPAAHEAPARCNIATHHTCTLTGVAVAGGRCRYVRLHSVLQAQRG